METKITLVLDAQKYHAELDKVIQSAKASSASIASTASAAGQAAADLGNRIAGLILQAAERHPGVSV